MVILQSNDNWGLVIGRDAIRLSTTLNTIMEERERDPNAGKSLNAPIPIPNVNGAILGKAIQWCQYHKDDPPINDSGNNERRTDDVCSWDGKFLKVDQGTLSELIRAAHYLGIEGLLDVACKTVANKEKDKSSSKDMLLFSAGIAYSLASTAMTAASLFDRNHKVEVYFFYGFLTFGALSSIAFFILFCTLFKIK